MQIFVWTCLALAATLGITWLLAERVFPKAINFALGMEQDPRPLHINLPLVQPSNIVAQDALTHGLLRQTQTPVVGSLDGSRLVPVFAFEVMPGPMRRLYDMSRTLDAQLLACLHHNSQEVSGATETRRQVEALHHMTRGVRRQLVVAMTSAPDEPLRATPLLTLEERLMLVQRFLQGL